VWGPQFAYTEDNPRSWRGGFLFNFFRNSDLMWPEPCWVIDEQLGKVGFRDRIYHV